jgi:hypothetical protein
MSDQRENGAGSPAAPPLVALAAWAVPGAGYWLIGQRLRGTVIGLTIILLFLFGILIGGIRIVDAPSFAGAGWNPLPRLLTKPWFIGQALTGPLGLGSAWIASNLAANRRYADVVPHARVAEIPTLYTAVAGMLNLLAIIDCSYRAAQGQHGEPADEPPDEADVTGSTQEAA